MRICPTCSTNLKEYNYYFCSKCLSELPQDKIKNLPPHLINLKLNYVLIPEEKFLFFKIPYENRFSLKVIKLLFYFVVIAGTVMFLVLNVNFRL